MPISTNKAAAPFQGRRPSAQQNRGGVVTATLLRGRVYVYANVLFEKGVPMPITAETLAKHHAPSHFTPEDVVAELEALFEEVRDSDGEPWDKPVFEIKHGQASSSGEQPADRVRRVRQIVEVPVKSEPARPPLRRPVPLRRVGG